MNDNHPDPAEIAALDEDLLSEEEAAELRQHLARCTGCAEIHTDLLALRQELRDLPVPPIPDDVAARIDAALAAEATAAQPTAPPTVPRQAASPDSRTDEPAVSRETTPTPVSSPRSQRTWPRMALAAAGAVVALGLGTILTESLVTNSGHGDDSGLADAEMDAPAEFASQPLEDQVRELLAETEEAPGTLSSLEGAGADESAASPESSPEDDAGGDAADEPSVETQSSPPVPQEEAEPLAAVPSCVEDAIGRREAPLAAEAEDYGGVNAYLVVFRHAADPEQVDAYVVDADCVSATPPESGEILAQRSYPLE
ncbi:anti-sigma factor family protein [Streptomyces mayteni]